MDTPQLIAALRCPEAYPHTVAEVQFLQTHISLLFFADDRVYKIKKPVNLGFVDYSSLERRQFFCQEEVRLNRRLALDIYLGVERVTQTNEGAVRIGGAGPTIEYAVVMVRLPEDRMLSRLLEHGDIGPEQLDELVALLARFHREAATGPGVDEYAAPDELRRQVDENFQQLERFVGDHSVAGGVIGGSWTLSTVLHNRLHRAAITFLDEHRDLLEKRMHQGRVREGHGDLHAGNICLTDQGIVIYDCIEFTPRFRCRDVACELAFLAMDLDFRVQRALAQRLVHRYAQLTGDAQMHRLVNFYKLHLAVVRGKVASLKSIDPNMNPSEREMSRREAKGYLHLAASYTLGPALIVMCGLPGSGKSWAARHFADSLGALVLQSDVIRKQLAGIDPADHHSGWAKNIYTREFSEQAYAELLERARNQMAAGRIVVADATFPSSASRAPFLELARSLHAPVMIVHCESPESVIRQRLERRADDLREVSDADWQVYRRLRERFEPPNEISESMRAFFTPQTDRSMFVGELVEKLIVQTEQAVLHTNDSAM